MISVIVPVFNVCKYYKSKPLSDVEYADPDKQFEALMHEVLKK